MLRTDIINKFIKDRHFTRYLEIGTFRNDNYNKINAIRCSVDPDPEAKANFCMTSDEFFKSLDKDIKYDIVFIDGLHEHSQVYRDIQNSLNHLNPNGIIVMHDCMPKNEKMQLWDNKSHQHEEWTGDTWKAYYKAFVELPYEVYVVDTDYGCGVIDTSMIRAMRPTGVDMENLKYTDYLYFTSTSQYGVIDVKEFSDKR